MKTIILILLFSITITLTACITSQTSSTDAVLMIDITEKSLAGPKADEVVRLFNLKENKWNGADFKSVHISEVSITPTAHARIEESNQWLSNEFEREEEIKRFEKDVRDIITKSEQTDIGKSRSSVYLPLARELNLLSQSKSEKKILIIYSDLFENTESLSFYRKKDFALLETKPELIKKEFEKLAKLDSLSGIEVWFIYQPSDSKNDRNFQVASGFFKNLLESKKAKVNISANLNL